MIKESKSLFILYAVFISYAYFGYVDIIGHLSSGNILLLFIGVHICLTVVIRGITTVRKDIFFIVSSFTLICICYLTADLLKGLDTTKFILYIIKVLIIPSIALLTGIIFIKDTDGQEKALRLFIVVMAVSSFVAILQFMGIEAMWQLRLFIQTPPVTESSIRIQFSQRTPVAGLAYYNVQLCYQLVTIFPFVVGMYFYSREKKNDNRFYKLCMAIILLAVIISKSVSAVISVLASLFCMYFLLRRYIHIPRQWLISLLVLCLTSLIVSGIYIEFTALDSSAFARIPLAAAGILSILESPLGHGSHNVQLYEFIDLLYNLRGSEQLEIVSSHNSFINTGLASGVFGLLISLSLYVFLFRTFIKRMKRADTFFEVCLYASSAAFLVGYFLQSSTHNSGLFGGDVLPWLIIGVVLIKKRRL